MIDVAPMGGYDRTTPGARPRCTVLRASDQTISTASDTDINFLSGATVEIDTDSMFDTADPDHVTVKVGGDYIIHGNVQWASNNDGRRDLFISINGDKLGFSRMPAMTGIGEIQQVVYAARLSIGDEIALGVRQTTGGNLAVVANDYSPRLAVVMV